VTDALLVDLTIFALAIFVGYEVISKVPVILHTPLMSGTNAIHGIVLVGGILVLGVADTVPAMILGAVAVFLGAVNVVGGFLVTDRMLLMFAKKRPDRPDPGAPAPK
jgi:NAD(P) transhydrogenase subunit alpha